MIAWEYDESTRSFRPCGRERLKTVGRRDLIVYLTDGELHVIEDCMTRRWRLGERLERDGISYVLPRAYHVDVYESGGTVPWRRELSSGFVGKR